MRGMRLRQLLGGLSPGRRMLNVATRMIRSSSLGVTSPAIAGSSVIASMIMIWHVSSLVRMGFPEIWLLHPEQLSLAMINIVGSVETANVARTRHKGTLSWVSQ